MAEAFVPTGASTGSRSPEISVLECIMVLSAKHGLAFVTAIWKVYSVTIAAEELENFARMPMFESTCSRRVTSKMILTSLSETTKVLLVGSDLSSGSAEANSQSSSVEVPLFCWASSEGIVLGALCAVGWAKSNREPD